MLLLDLPPELFEQIINDLVRGESSAKMFKYREISRIFDTYVLDALSKRPIGRGKRDVYRKFGARFPTAFGHAILCKLVLQRSDTSRAVITFVTGIVDMLVDRSVQSDTDNRETLRTLYVQQICNALRDDNLHFLKTFLMTEREIMEWDRQSLLPAAAAAVGDVKIFLDNISDVYDIFAVHHTYFPNALNAAVAAGQTEMVKTILWYAVNNTRGPWITGNWKEMRITSRALFRALKVAIHLHQSEIGHLIAYTLSENRHLHESIPGELNDQLYEDCILHSNVEFLTLALHYKREAAWLSPDGSLDKPTQD